MAEVVRNLALREKAKGLSAGEKIVVDGVDRLRDGAPVELSTPESRQGGERRGGGKGPGGRGPGGGNGEGLSTDVC